MAKKDEFKGNIVDKTIDFKEEQILREIIKDPTISDNQISKKTGIPVKTVNRKRKRMENNNYMYYFVVPNNGREGTGVFSAMQLYTIYFDYGISREQVLGVLNDDKIMNEPVLRKHILTDWLGEKDGRVAYHCIIRSRVESDIIEIVNVEIVPKFTSKLGSYVIKNIEVMQNVMPLRVFHNYFPDYNMEKGKIKKEVPKENIFVC
ncbi:MAG: winged helix-turn-helix domain-containing protein [Candidatus Woesearchaeota archaeon]